MNRATFYLLIGMVVLLLVYGISMLILVRELENAKAELENAPVVEKLKVVTNEIERLRVVEKESISRISDAGAFSNVTNLGDAIRLYHSLVD